MKKTIFTLFLLFSSSGAVFADASTTIDADISPSGEISAFSVSCSGTNATALLINDVEPIFNYVYGIYYMSSVGPYMRRPCSNGIVHFDSFDLNKFLVDNAGNFPSWLNYYHSPFKVVVKDTSDLWAYDAPEYNGLVNLANSQNNYNRVVYGIYDQTYSTLASGPTFDFDGNKWKIYSSLEVKPECCSSVLFVPGLEASRLYVLRDNNTEDQLWEPNSKSDLEDLYLNQDGSSIKNDIYTKDIIKETNSPIPTGSAGQNIYKSFSETMDSLVSDGRIAEWKAYAYDWRKSINDILDEGTLYDSENKSIKKILEELIQSSINGKVTIIAHSNGGLLTKALLARLQKEKEEGKNNLIDNVDVVILVGVPEIGTPSAVPAILHGFDQRIALGWLMDEIHARELGRNMPGAYGLLPSKEYINRVSASPVTFVDNTIPSQVTTDFVNNYGNSLSSYSSYRGFLFGDEGRKNPSVDKILLPIKLSTDLFSEAEELHNVIDNWVPPESTRMIEVAGWGLDTIASFEYYPVYQCNSPDLGTGKCGYVLDERPRFTIDGDKTVVVPSAHYVSDTKGKGEKYWVNLPVHNTQLNFIRKNRSHKDLFEVKEVEDFIDSSIKKEFIVFNSVFTSVEPESNTTKFHISVHSPVTLSVYDTAGNFTGKVCPEGSDFCYVEENIPNTSYLEFGEGKYLNIDKSSMDKIILRGTDVGTFTLNIESVSPQGVSTTTSFVDIPVTSQMYSEITINSNTQKPDLKMDVNGDGKTDITLEPNNVFDPILYLKVIRKNIENFDINKLRKALLLKRIDDTIKVIQKGKISAAKLKVELFKKTLNLNYRTLERFDEFKWFKYQNKNKTLTQEEIQLLINMLDDLLNNLNK